MATTQEQAIIILLGFYACGCRRGVVVLPGLGNASGDYDELVEQLEERNYSVGVAKVARYDWLRNAAVGVRPLLAGIDSSVRNGNNRCKVSVVYLERLRPYPFAAFDSNGYQRSTEGTHLPDFLTP